MKHRKKALIIGAGPAGLTAAYELLTRTDIQPIVIERSSFMGGLSRTVNYKGNRIDIGGHRFFSKSDRVMQWWLSILPMEEDMQVATTTDNIMLMRSRKSRIYFMRKFFDYPLQLNIQTLNKLGFITTIKIGLSYVAALIWPRKEKNLEDFFINRFGKRLYETFFKSYTEKVWGVPCAHISASWGAQRIKGVSILKSIVHFFKSLLPQKNDIAQKKTETSLIQYFLYPKFGPGHMWEVVADAIKARGGEIITHANVDAFKLNETTITYVRTNTKDQEPVWHEVDYVISTTSVQELIQAFPSSSVPASVKSITQGLQYRDFITVGLLVDALKITENGNLITDNWIYIQEPDVLVGRLQIFNNWSPFMVADPSTVWIGLEYFCYTTDKLWNMTDQELIELGKQELAHIGIIDASQVKDGTVIKTEKAYPAYFGTYDQFDEVKAYLNTIDNLFLLGRNGQHKYNNQDHSMLTAMMLVDGLTKGTVDRQKLWSINTESEYHEEKK